MEASHSGEAALGRQPVSVHGPRPASSAPRARRTGPARSQSPPEIDSEIRVYPALQNRVLTRSTPFAQIIFTRDQISLNFWHLSEVHGKMRLLTSPRIAISSDKLSMLFGYSETAHIFVVTGCGKVCCPKTNSKIFVRSFKSVREKSNEHPSRAVQRRRFLVPGSPSYSRRPQIKG